MREKTRILIPTDSDNKAAVCVFSFTFLPQNFSNIKTMHKPAFLSFFIFLSTFCGQRTYAQQDSLRTITTMRMGVFRVQTSSVEIEKIIDQKLKLRDTKEYYIDTIPVIHEGVNYDLYFTKT